jgi:N-acetylneuraminic acid mutarotase
MGAAIGQSMYLLGGLDASGSSSSDVYRIRPATGQVTLAGHLAVATHGAGAVAFGNRVVVFGGADLAPDDLVQAFDPLTGTTTVTGHMPSARADLVAALVGGRMIVLAGFTGSAFISDIWATPDGRSFSVVGQVAQNERYPATAVMGSTIYLFGGLVAGGEYDGTYSTTIQSFDTVTGRSQLVGQLPVPLAHARAAVVGGQALLFGGWTPHGASSAILRFNPATGGVTPVGTLPEAVADEAIAPIGDSVYFASGLGTGQQPLVQIGSLTVTPST